MTLFHEILEQTVLFDRLYSNQKDNIVEIANVIKENSPKFIFLAARGTSDNAGRYANYLWGSNNQLPVALATPSLFTFYGKPPRLEGALVVGISQSGQSPDIVKVLEEGRRRGQLTLAITNSPDSPLANAAEYTIDICAGLETAVAATKTYTAELMAIALLSVILKEDNEQLDHLMNISEWIEQVLRLDDHIARIAERYRYMNQCVVIGRGYNYATAFEWSLKLKEMTYTIAEPYSSADFRHGPIAMIERGFPIMAVAPEGHVFEDIRKLLLGLKNDLGAELLVISDHQEALDLAQSPLALPKGIPEWLTPLVAIVPAQLFAYYLTLVKGFDADNPRTIQKVTQTQ
jgi:glutamine---fructose-6-phosphate transaminase (isomerizing)